MVRILALSLRNLSLPGRHDAGDSGCMPPLPRAKQISHPPPTSSLQLVLCFLYSSVTINKVERIEQLTFYDPLKCPMVLGSAPAAQNVTV